MRVTAKFRMRKIGEIDNFVEIYSLDGSNIPHMDADMVAAVTGHFGDFDIVPIVDDTTRVAIILNGKNTGNARSNNFNVSVVDGEASVKITGRGYYFKQALALIKRKVGAKKYDMINKQWIMSADDAALVLSSDMYM
jgi:hypothetical protein